MSEKTNQNQQSADSYDVVVEGKIIKGFSRKQVLRNLAQSFKMSEEKVAPLLDNQSTKVKQSISHKAAYEFQQLIINAGLNAKLIRIPGVAAEPTYSMVPEGEESTPYQVLAARHRSGETVICKHCFSEQTIAPYCKDCGKQLIAKAGAMPKEVSTQSISSLVKLVVFAVAIIAAIGFGFIYFS